MTIFTAAGFFALHGKIRFDSVFSLNKYLIQLVYGFILQHCDENNRKSIDLCFRSIFFSQSVL